MNVLHRNGHFIVINVKLITMCACALTSPKCEKAYLSCHGRIFLTDFYFCTSLYCMKMQTSNIQAQCALLCYGTVFLAVLKLKASLS